MHQPIITNQLTKTIMHTLIKNTLAHYQNLDFNQGLFQFHTMEHHINQDGTHIATFILEVTPELSEDKLDNALNAITEAYTGIQDIILENTPNPSDFFQIPNGFPNKPNILIYASDTNITITLTDLTLVITLVTFEQ